MHYIADLHIHSPYSRATSKLSHLHGLAAWAAIKGIDVVGTGDFTHPGWMDHLKKNLEEAEPGFFRLKDTSPELYKDVIPPGLEPDVSHIRFVLTSEISSIYKRGGKVRKVHNILFSPDMDSVRRISVALSAIGNIESDGRPILGLDSHDLLEILLENAPEGFLVPAHIWTPWFSLFGSKSGFDSIEECFGDLTSHIFALETGLSSDPDMNRTISALDKYSLISNSDCHSPGKLGREANLFSTDFDFYSMREALKYPVDDNGKQRFTSTIEFYPEEGKYHCDGHRKCKVCMEPQETREHKGICPECGKAMTVGVLYRVMELADRATPVYPEGSPAVHSLVPLQELLGELLQVGPASKKVMQAYVKLIQQFGSEFGILLEKEIKELERGSSSHLAEAVHRVRTGKVIRQPGYDGEFGVIRVFSESERKGFGGQMNLFGEVDTNKPKKTRRRIKKVPVKDTIQEGKSSSKKKKLNPEQQQVVESKARHILVKAGPGTGKTHTLVQRVVKMVKDQNLPCTVITFTNKAAKELDVRLSSVLGNNHDVHVSTMHGYCLEWLRKKRPGINIAGPDLRKWFLRLLNEKKSSKKIQQLDEEITTFLQQAPDLHRNIPEHLNVYFSMLSKENFVDIDAVIPSFAALVHEQGKTGEAIRQRTGMLFVDEFQDLNQSQYEVIRLMADTSPVFAIGDPDQAIYGFRGSNPEWFFKFNEELKPHLYHLYRNYRNTSVIVEAADKLISYNPHFEPDVQSKSIADGSGGIFLNTLRSPRHEATFIVHQVEKLIGGTSHREIERIHQANEQMDITLRDIAVLYRTTRQADIIAKALFEHGIPVQVVDIRPYYLNEPVRPLYLWVLLVTGHADITHLTALLKDDPGIGKKQLRELEMSVPGTTKDILDTVAGRKGKFSVKLAEKIEEFTTLREKMLQVSIEGGLKAFLDLVLSRYNLKADEPDIVRFCRMADNFDTSMDTFAKHLLLHNDSVVYDERAEAVTLMTLHASKGLEFKVVFMVGLEEGMLPISYRREYSGISEEKHIEEERRLFYVGMTRAEKILYLTHVANRRKDAQDVPQEQSRFVHEIPQKLLGSVESTVKKRTYTKKAEQLQLFD